MKNSFLKRIFDLTFSLIGLIISSPLLIIFGLLIKIHDRGPILYRGIRTGKHNNQFKMYKFRSMVINAEKIGGSSTSNTDNRITPIGKLLRKYKLDELPQLFNVFRGDMSFVGPRPEVKYYTDMYNEEEKKILQLRPGITDWASLWNDDEGSILQKYENPDKAYEEIIRPEKIRLQLKYYYEHSFLIDIKIIILTLLKIIKK